MEISDQWTEWPCRPAKTPRRRPTKDEGQRQAQKSPYRPPSHRTSAKPSGGRGVRGANGRRRRKKDDVLASMRFTPRRENRCCSSLAILAAAAYVILLFFAAGYCKSYWGGCKKAATVICQQIFSILALAIFLLNILIKSVSKSFFCPLASRSGFGAAISDAVARSSIVFLVARSWSCNFRRRWRRSHCSGCVKVASCRGCVKVVLGSSLCKLCSTQ